MKTPMVQIALWLRMTSTDRGAGVVEYALLVALIAVACLVALQAFGITNGGSINNTSSRYTSAVG